MLCRRWLRPARGLDLATAAVKLGGGEVVEQDRVDACGEDCFDLVGAIDFYFDMSGVGKSRRAWIAELR